MLTRRLILALIASALGHLALAALIGTRLPEVAGGRPHRALNASLRPLPEPAPEAAAIAQTGNAPAPPSLRDDYFPAPPAAKAVPIADPALQYYRLRELDVRPTVVKDVPMDPDELRRYPQGGHLVMELWLDEEGRVVDAAAVESDLPPEFVQSAATNFRLSLFTPGMKGGYAVRTRMKVAVDYAPTELGTKALLTSPGNTGPIRPR